MRRSLSIAIALAAGPLGAAQQATDRPNLLLVTIDTLRADRLGAYGHTGAETPFLDALAADGVLVEDVTAHAPQTTPSHASILTGLLPPEHGIRDNFSPPLRQGLPTLASVLKERGWATGAFIGALPVSARSGLDRGFDRYDDPFGEGGGRTMLSGSSERRGGEVVDAALEWLRGAGEPFFGWVHLYDPHEPYDPPTPFAGRHADDPYDGEVAYADAQVGRLLEYLDGAGLRDSTFVVVTADHGEGLGDHGEEEHLLLVYDSTLRVPLILSRPGVLAGGRRLVGQFRLIDLMPTLLNMLGVRPPATSGVSRSAELISGSPLPDTESYAESLYGQIHFGYAPLRSLRAEGWKYIEAPRPELYQVREDPGETENLVDLRGQVAERMAARLATYDEGDGASPEVAADAGLMERLAALGYVGGGASRTGAAAGADPKDKVEEYERYKRDTREATRLMRQGEVDRALPILERLAKADTISFESQFLLGTALVAKGRFDEGIEPLETALDLLPDHVASYIDLAKAYSQTGRTDDALALLARGLERAPGNGPLLEAQGLLLLEAGRPAEARAPLERARELAPRNFQLRLALSAAQRDSGDVGAAIAELQDAVQRGPRFALGWNALGVLLAGAGRSREAQAAFERAHDLIPRDPDVLLNLARARTATGDREGARALLDELLTARPDHPGAREALAALGAAAPAAPAGGAPTGGEAVIRLLGSETRTGAQDLAARLAAGDDVAEVAAAADRDLGRVQPEDLAPVLQDAARTLPPGSVSGVFQVGDRYLVLYRER